MLVVSVSQQHESVQSYRRNRLNVELRLLAVPTRQPTAVGPDKPSETLSDPNPLRWFLQSPLFPWAGHH